MSAANFAALLAKTEAVKSSQNLYKMMQQVNEAKKTGGLQEATDLFKEISNVGLTENALKILVAEIKASTTQESVALFREVLTLMQSDSANSFMSVTESTLNRMIGNATDLVALMNRFEAMSGDSGPLARFYAGLQQYVFGPLEGLLAIFNGMADAAERIKNAQGSSVESDPRPDWWTQFLTWIRDVGMGNGSTNPNDPSWGATF